MKSIIWECHTGDMLSCQFVLILIAICWFVYYLSWLRNAILNSLTCCVQCELWALIFITSRLLLSLYSVQINIYCAYMQKVAAPQHVARKLLLIYFLELWLCPQSHQICTIWIFLKTLSKDYIFITSIFHFNSVLTWQGVAVCKLCFPVTFHT